jgi:hypothetical protein
MKCPPCCFNVLRLVFAVGMKRPLDDDYEEEQDDRKRRRGDGPKVELRFLLASKVSLTVGVMVLSEARSGGFCWPAR